MKRLAELAAGAVLAFVIGACLALSLIDWAENDAPRLIFLDWSDVA